MLRMRDAFNPPLVQQHVILGHMSVQRSRVNRGIQTASVTLERGSKRAKLSKRLRQDTHLTRPSASSAQCNILRPNT